MRREAKGINEPSEERAALGQSKGGVFSILSTVRTAKGNVESGSPNELKPSSFPSSFNLMALRYRVVTQQSRRPKFSSW